MVEVSWECLSSHNSANDMWIAIDGRAYDVTEWSRQHPGGALVLLHLAGKDATQPFNASHPTHVKIRLSGFCCGVMIPSCPTPPSKEALAFAKLEKAVEDCGLLKPRTWPYLFAALLLTLLFILAAYLAQQGRPVAAALTVALFWQQLAFIGHDLGHSAVTQSRQGDGLLGLAVNAGLGIGMSWWKSTHNVHHMVVNAADSDPDIQFMPLLAVSEHFFEEVWSKYHQDRLVFDSAARALISWQHFTFLPLLTIAKFGLYLQTIKHLMGGKAYIHKRSEAVAQAIFFAWYLSFVLCFPDALRKLTFILVSHAAFAVLHLQICLSHFACPTHDKMPRESEDWMSHQVRGTMNWGCPAWLDWFHGGLQFQIEHHLFPRMPRHNLRAASKLVKPTCQKLGLPYHSPSFSQAFVETLQTLRAIALKAQRQKIFNSSSKIRQAELLSRALI